MCFSLLLLLGLVEAHVKLFYAPVGWPIRNAKTATSDGTFSTATSDGCGGQPMWGKNGATKVSVGQSVTLSFNYGTTVNGDHKSAANAFRVVFASFDSAPDIASENAALKAGMVLASNIPAVNGSRPLPYTATVAIPNVQCKRCVLQVIDQRNWGACYDVFTVAAAPTAAATTTTTTSKAPTTAAPTTTRAPLPPGVTAAPTTRPPPTTVRPAVCGNGVVEPGEQCEAADGPCCTDCKFTPRGTQCRAKMASLACDVADTCSGSSADCADAVADAGTVCRAAPADAGVCVGDAKCDGVMGLCPPTNPVALGKLCDDGVACTEGDSCGRNGKCFGVWTCPCKTDDECNSDGDSCTSDVCKITDGVGACNRDDAMDKMEGAPCSDNNPCTMNDKCNAEAVCVGETKCSKAAGACGEAERRGACCGDKCVCNAGWAGDNDCASLAPSCAVGNKGCACDAKSTCSTSLKCDFARKVCVDPAGVVGETTNTADQLETSASTVSQSLLVAVAALVAAVTTTAF